MVARAPNPGQIAGRAVDAQGASAIDPSENVKALSEAASLRQDDLRMAEARRQDDLRVAQDKLSAVKERYLKDMAELRAEHSSQMMAAEAKRIDAIRAVDVNAVAVASQRASDQASVLAAQVQQSAEALRALVATTANTVAQAQQQLESTLSARITTLEQFQYKGEGRQAGTDPALAELFREVTALASARSEVSGRDTGHQTDRSNLIAIIGSVLGVGGLILAMVVFISSRSNEQAVAVPAERVVIEGAQSP